MKSRSKKYQEFIPFYTGGKPISEFVFLPEDKEPQKLLALLKWATDREIPLYELEVPIRIFLSNDVFKSKTCLKMVKMCGHAIELIPKKFWTPEVVEVCFKMRTLSLKNLPLRFKTKKICKLAIEYDPYDIFHLPERAPWYEEILTSRIKKRPEIIFFIPEKNRTLAMCFAAVKKDLNMMTYVPSHLKDEIEKRLKIRK